jgi:hypothetical protein
MLLNEESIRYLGAPHRKEDGTAGVTATGANFRIFEAGSACVPERITVREERR